MTDLQRKGSDSLPSERRGFDSEDTRLKDIDDDSSVPTPAAIVILSDDLPVGLR
jgi:hypothetical protein